MSCGNLFWLTLDPPLFLQESALKEALKSFSMLPKGEGIEQFVVRLYPWLDGLRGMIL